MRRYICKIRGCFAYFLHGIFRDYLAVFEKSGILAVVKKFDFGMANNRFSAKKIVARWAKKEPTPQKSVGTYKGYLEIRNYSHSIVAEGLGDIS